MTEYKSYYYVVQKGNSFEICSSSKLDNLVEVFPSFEIAKKAIEGLEAFNAYCYTLRLDSINNDEKKQTRA